MKEYSLVINEHTEITITTEKEINIGDKIGYTAVNKNGNPYREKFGKVTEILSCENLT